MLVTLTQMPSLGHEVGGPTFPVCSVRWLASETCKFWARGKTPLPGISGQTRAWCSRDRPRAPTWREMQQRLRGPPDGRLRAGWATGAADVPVQGWRGGRRRCSPPRSAGLRLPASFPLSFEGSRLGFAVSLFLTRELYGTRSRRQPHGDEGRLTGTGYQPAHWPFQLHLNLPRSAPLLTPSISLDAENPMP